MVTSFYFPVTLPLASPASQYLAIRVTEQAAGMKVTQVLEEFQGSVSWATGDQEDCRVNVIDIQESRYIHGFQKGIICCQTGGEFNLRAECCHQEVQAALIEIRSKTTQIAKANAYVLVVYFFVEYILCFNTLSKHRVQAAYIDSDFPC